MNRPLKSALSGVCFALGAVWALAAALKLIFGIAVSFPLLPPFDLEQVHVVRSIITALVLFGVGAVLGRPRSVERERNPNASERAV